MTVGELIGLLSKYESEKLLCIAGEQDDFEIVSDYENAGTVWIDILPVERE